MNYKWELSGELDYFINLENPVSIEREGVLVQFIPSVRRNKKFIDFHIRTETRDKSVEDATIRCRTIFYRILDMCAFLESQGIKARFRPIVLMNEEELINKGLPLPEDREFIVPRVQYEPRISNFGEAMSLYERVEHNLRGADLFRCISWFSRGLKADDEIDKFISLWISFNILYETYYRKRPHERPNQLNFIQNVVDLYDYEFKEKLLTGERNQQLIADLISYESSDGEKTKCGYRLQKNINTNMDYAFENFLLCMYRIRCDLFHGDKPLFQLYPLVKDCNRVLVDIIKEGVMKYL
ncbi:MAG TPA: hypothetical protein EYP86_03585 [Candidatus Altiarchaeales archaeon]|nr:hypothetical protein [Candidatus Altiarchaeales archaeon]